MKASYTNFLETIILKQTQHLRAVYTDGDVVYSRIITRNNIEGYEKLYSYKGSYSIFSGIGTNGFIVSAYSLDEDVTHKLIKR